MSKKLKRLVGQRDGLRTAFTAAIDEFKKCSENEVKSCFNIIEHKFNKLKQKNDEIQDNPEFDEENMSSEVLECERYEDIFIQIKTVYDQKVNTVTFENLKKSTNNFKFNKLQPIQYDVNPTNWTAFWGQFRRIHEDSSIECEDKFQYLLRCIKPGTKAYKLVESYPPFGGNYVNMIEHLQRRFGKDSLVIEASVRVLLNIVIGEKKLPLNELVDALGAQIRTLTALGVGSDKYQLFLYPLLEKCIPKDVLEIWLLQSSGKSIEDTDEDSLSVLSNATKIDKVQALMAFLERLVENKEHIEAVRSSIKPKEQKDFEVGNGKTASALVSSTLVNNCLFCDNTNHKTPNCRKALKFSVSERREVIKDKRGCFNCLQSTTHQASNCRKNVKCSICGRRHFDIVCDKELAKPNVSERSNSANNLVNAAVSEQNVVYMKTLRAKLRVSGGAREVRIFLDDGSTKSYITNKLALELGFKPIDKLFLTHGLFGGFETVGAHHFVYNVNLCNVKSLIERKIVVVGQDRLCHDIGGVRDGKLLTELRSRGIEIFDVSPVAEVDILLGSDMIPRILTGRMQILPSGVVATETVLGWVVQGVGRQNVQKVMSCLNVCKESSLWDLDVLGIEAPEPVTELGDGAVTHFKNTVSVNEEGRYIVSLPWKAGHPPLSSNKSLAEARLHSTTKKLRDAGLFPAYDEVLKNWLANGVTEIVQDNKVSDGIVHYMPHLAVQKPNSRSFKVRPVFDASAHKQGNVSLNQCLNKGPNLIPLILPLLLKFRMGQYAATADIKTAFLMLEIDEKDRDALRFLWWVRDSIVVFRHKRVVFGLAPSPFLLNAAIGHLLEEDHPVEWASTIAKLKNAFYVDNVLFSCETENELMKFKEESEAILLTRKFELRDWMSNSPLITEDSKTEENVLGLRWSISSDKLAIDGTAFMRALEGTITKRKVLSLANAIYDPLGTLAAVTLVPKLIIQEAWKRGIQWDEELPFDLLKRLKDWCASIEVINQCAIPRSLKLLGSEDVSLHLFCDSSGKCFSACAFLRIEGTEPILRFVVAKARVGPVQPLSMPRMELLGACIAARLYKTIIDSFQRSVKTYFWTDSSVVLCWITKREPWKTFVGNRVSEIRKLTDVRDWRHVTGSMNPADLISRSCDAKEFMKKRWLEGPQWLLQPPETWPKSFVSLPDEIALSERKKISVISASNLCEGDELFSTVLTRYFSKYSKLLNMVAWMIRFAYNARKRVRTVGALSLDELDAAEQRLIWLVQKEWSKECCHTLRMYEDRNGILRIKTKIVMLSDCIDFKEPVVIVDNPIVRRLITYVHEKANHASVQTTLIILRERFWLIKGRRIIRQVLSKCVVCKKLDSKPIVPIEAPLPVDRCNIKVGCFEICGVDLTGPLWLKDREKAWIVVFTCAVFRCVHLEMVTSISAESFLQAVRRMTARRGDVSIFWCDNGTNFKASSNALSTVDWEEIAARGATQRLRFRFITPSSPWFGGWWEIINKLLKSILKKSLGSAFLNYEEMLTVLCDCERTVNSRPLTYLSSAEELATLTPAMFLYEPRGLGGADIDIVEEKSLNKRLVYVQKVRNHLKQRFRREYLSQLVNFRINKHPKTVLKVGDIVLVGAENTKRIDWPLARILELYEGKDGETRVAKVKTASNELLRPVKKLYPLEVRSEQECIVDDELICDDLSEERQSTANGEGNENIDFSGEPQYTRKGRLVKRPPKLDL